MAVRHPLEALRARLASGEGLVAGVLSGTSGDGIDVGLLRFPPWPSGGADVEAPELVAFDTRPFPGALGARVRAVLDGAAHDWRTAALLSRDLGLAFGRAARELSLEQGVVLDLVASHGQTVWHHDGLEPSGPATLQLGDGDFVAAAAGAPVVSDFRQADVAAGGEGAPLSALADGVLFAPLARPAAILNLGGMANLTLLEERGTRAFDTGPAGSLLDGLARRCLGTPFDPGGAAAGRGRADPELVQALLDHPFFERAPPKSTGRDTFGEAWVDGVLARARSRGPAPGMRPEDLLASAVRFVAASVGLGLRRFGPPGLSRLVVAGGGVRNAALLAALAAELAIPVEPSSAHGVDPKAREALVFGVLGARAVLGIPSTDPGASGARRGMVLGKLSFGAPGA